MALDAYPEAYDEFKHIMSMLVFHGQQAAALVAFPGHQDFTDSAREDLANTIFHTLASITGEPTSFCMPILWICDKYASSAIHAIMCITV